MEYYLVNIFTVLVFISPWILVAWMLRDLLKDKPKNATTEDPLDEAEANAPRPKHPITQPCACVHCYRQPAPDDTDMESGC